MVSKKQDIADMVMELGRTVRKTMASRTQKEESPILMHGLSFVAEKPGMTMSEFAASMCSSPSTATMFVSKLAKGGLVRRIADKRNRRSVLLHLTPKGKRTLERHRRVKQDAFKEIFSVLSPADRRNLERIFSLLLDSSRSPHD